MMKNIHNPKAIAVPNGRITAELGKTQSMNE